MAQRICILFLATLLLFQEVRATTPFTRNVQSAVVAKCDSMIMRSTELLTDEPLEALSLAQAAWRIAQNDPDKELQLRALRTVANAELGMGLKMEFMRTIMRSLDIATDLGEPRHMAIALRDLSKAYRMNLRMDQAVVEAKNSLAMLQPLHDTAGIAEAHQFLVKTLLLAHRYSESLLAAPAALEACSALNDEVCQARVHLLIARNLIGMEKQADALPILTKAERILKSLGNDMDRFELAIDRSRTMLGLGLTHYARISMDEASEILPAVNNTTNQTALLQLRYELALAMKQWEVALAHLQRIKAQSDSLEIARVDMKMAGLQVIHEVKSKELDNALLKDLNAQQAETIAGQRSSNRLLLVLITCLVILAVALFITSRYAMRAMQRLGRKNQVIKRQNDEIQGKVLELKRQNLRLAESLMSEEEKELILKEIHHRVKNNLQVVDSLLNIQGNDVEDPRLKGLLKDAQGRIRSMAMVHEHIYRASGDLHASLRSHVEKLARSVLVAHGAHDRISIHVDSDLPTFPVETMLPLSLVVNELLTNSLKHAFAGSGSGNIRIAVKSKDTGYELRYSDDGIGMGQVAGITGNRTFGHELIRILAHQLNGELHMVHGDGAVLSMTFTPDKDLMRKAS